MYRFAAILSGITFFISSCTSDKNPKPLSIGRISEIAVIVPESGASISLIKSLNGCLTSEYPGLPQAEPQFNVSTFSNAAFSGLVPLHKNILFIELSSKEQNAALILTAQRNVFANPQLVLRLKISTKNTDGTLPDSICHTLIQYFNREERNRLIESYRKSGDKALSEMVFSKSGIRIHLPGGFSLALEKENFLWLRKETENTSTGILVYSYKISGGDLPSPNTIIQVRDSVGKKYVLGPSPNSFMITDSNYPVIQYHDQMNEYRAVITRCLWKTENDFMGGPFFSATFKKDSSDQVYCIEGFVYAPKFEKRDYIKQLEAVLYSAGSD